MAEMGKAADGTESDAVETGEHAEQAEEGKGKQETAPEGGEAGEQTAEEKQAAEEAAEAAAEREREIREKTPGTLEYAQAKLTKEKDARKKLGISLTAEKEQRIRLEERLKVMEELGGTKKPADAKGKPAEKLTRPRMKDFESQDEYDVAMDAYDEELVARVSRSVTEDVKKTVGVSAAQTEWDKKASEVISRGQKEYKDFDKVTDPENLVLSLPMSDAIVELGEEGHHVEYALGLNPEEAERIGKLTPPRQFVELTRMADRLAAERKLKPKARIPAGPAPVKTVKGDAEPVTNLSAIKDDAEWYKKKRQLNHSSA